MKQMKNDRFYKIKKLIARILILVTVFNALPIISSNAANTYTINGVSVRYDDFSSSPDECWAYANNIYNKIWGQKFNSLFDDSANSLRNLSDSELTLTEEHLKKYVTNAPLGATLRICSSTYLHGSDGWGHSQIIVQKDDNGFTVFEGGLSASPYCREKYYTWSEYCSTSWLGGSYGYIKYVKWPGAEVFVENYLPTGTLDSVEANTNQVIVNGWAFDKDDLNRDVEIHVYIESTCIGVTKANQYRPDVNSHPNYLGVGEYHGYELTCPVSKDLTGTQTVKVFAIDNEGQGNPTLGSWTITIPADTTEPVIENIIVEGDSNGYTVICDVSDDSGIDHVQFPTWTDYNGQDDLQGSDGTWKELECYRGTVVDNKATFRVNRSEHNWEKGIYYTHIYAYDIYGNRALVDTISFEFEEEGPQIDNEELVLDDTGYTVSFDVSDESGISNAQIDSWTTASGVDDLVSIIIDDEDIVDGKVSYHVNISDHNYELGEYNTIIYVWDKLGNESEYVLETVKFVDTDDTYVNPFSDVSDTAWYASPVQYVYENGLMSGNNGLFNPTGNVTRAQLVTTLYNIEGNPEVVDYSACEELVDVKRDMWYTNAICWAYSVGVASGNTSTKMFNMSTSVTRQQLATFFYNYAEYKGLDITVREDISDMVGADEVASYALDTMKWAVGTGLITGSASTSTDGTTVYKLNPKGTATRAQLASILQRFCENNNL